MREYRIPKNHPIRKWKLYKIIFVVFKPTTFWDWKDFGLSLRIYKLNNISNYHFAIDIYIAWFNIWLQCWKKNNTYIKKMKNTNPIVAKLRQGNQWLISFIMVRTFLLSSQKRQNYLIMKNASMFLGLQNLAKKYDNQGDLRTAMEISAESYDYLGNFALYCNAKGIDQFKRLEMYAP